MQVEISLSTRSVSQFEPVWISLAFSNQLGEPLRVDLGAKRAANIDVSLKSSTGILRLSPAVNIGGFGPPPTIELEPLATYEQRVLLSDRFPTFGPGSYADRVVFRGLLSKDWGRTQPEMLTVEQTLDLEVRPIDEARLQTVCSELSSTVATEIDFTDRSRAAIALKYASHPVCIASIQKLLNKNSPFLPQLTAGLASMENRAAVEALAPFLTDEDEMVAGYTRMAVNTIRRNTQNVDLRARIDAILQKLPAPN